MDIVRNESILASWEYIRDAILMQMKEMKFTMSYYDSAFTTEPHKIEAYSVGHLWWKKDYTRRTYAPVFNWRLNKGEEAGHFTLDLGFNDAKHLPVIEAFIDGLEQRLANVRHSMVVNKIATSLCDYISTNEPPVDDDYSY